MEHVRFVPIADIVSDRAQQKTPGRFSVSPEGFPATYEIRSGGLLPLPPPAQQTQRAEAGGEEWECGREWG